MESIIAFIKKENDLAKLKQIITMATQRLDIITNPTNVTQPTQQIKKYLSLTKSKKYTKVIDLVTLTYYHVKRSDYHITSKISIIVNDVEISRNYDGDDEGNGQVNITIDDIIISEYEDYKELSFDAVMKDLNEDEISNVETISKNVGLTNREFFSFVMELLEIIVRKLYIAKS